MKNKKGFTLLELLVTVSIITILSTLIVSGMRGCSGDYTMDELLYPEQVKARSQRGMVDEMRRSNDLKEEELRNLRQAGGQR